MIPPGSTIGMLGGGQLGRMLAVAAARLGYRVHVYAPEDDLPAGDVAAHVTRAAYDDHAALAAFARSCAVVTYEFENVPVDAVAALSAYVPVRPGARALEVAQDRAAEKAFAQAHGGTPAPWMAVDDLRGLYAALAHLGTPAILKSRRLGYDGKGQARIATPADADAAWATVGGVPCVLEGVVQFDAEFSVLVARGLDGATVVYDAPENTHADGILRTSRVPAAAAHIAPHLPEARALAERVAAALDYVGLLTLEFFACGAGPVFNELAPRVHNSGHWTIEGAVTDQFENHIRAVCGLPLGVTTLRQPVVMENLIGDDVDRWPALLADPRARPHLYGKAEVQPGRKMGHVTWL